MRDNKGFTLIELLIVVVIIGILAAIAIPKFSATREKAFVSTMKSDLKNLASQQEIYYSDGNYQYSAVPADLEFAESEGVTVTITASNTDWSATASHTAIDVDCEIFYGSATGPGSIANVAGVVTCNN